MERTDPIRHHDDMDTDATDGDGLDEQMTEAGGEDTPDSITE